MGAGSSPARATNLLKIYLTMILHNVSGCMAFSLNIDGKEEIDMTDKERMQVIDKIYEWMKRHPELLNNILQDLSSLGEYKIISDEPCECCGDIVDEYVLDFDE